MIFWVFCCFFLILCIILHLLSTSYLNRGQLIIEWIDLQICTCIYVHQDLFISLIAEKRQPYYITYINSRLIFVYYIIYIISFLFRWNATPKFIFYCSLLLRLEDRNLFCIYYIFIYVLREEHLIYLMKTNSLWSKKKISVCLSHFSLFKFCFVEDNPLRCFLCNSANQYSTTPFTVQTCACYLHPIDRLID